MAFSVVATGFVDGLMDQWWFPWIFVALALVSVAFSLRAGRRKRLVDNLPTSKSTGVFIGLVVLKGKAEAEYPLVGHLSGERCVHYQWQVEEHWTGTVTETTTDSEGRTQEKTRTEKGWTTVAQGSEAIPFYLQDDCGVIRVQPDKAKLEPVKIFEKTCKANDPLYFGKGPAKEVDDSDGKRRFTELIIPLHAQLYVVGHARERDDMIAPEIAHDASAEMFLISTRSVAQVSRSLRWQFWGLGLLGLLLTVGGFMLRDLHLKQELAEHIFAYVGAGGLFLVAWLLGWTGMAYNSLITLRQRVRQGWSNMDVQLKRRCDLIPNLVSSLKSLRDHERTLQTELAQLRSQLTAPVENAGSAGQPVAGTINSVIERYPELLTNELFMNVRQNIIDTEHRIALARDYFNDIAEFYNVRIGRIPDRFLAATGGLKSQPLISAADFERVPVEVTLAT